MTPEFMAGERVRTPKLKCTECGGPAQGNVFWTDGSGEICDKCHEEMMAEPTNPSPNGNK